MPKPCLPPRLCPRLSPFCAPLMVLLALALLMPAVALAHRVNIFAWTESGQVVVECSFNGGNKVKQGEITVFDTATDKKLLEGRTDDAGVFRFPIPPEGAAHGLRIRVRGGEGHQNDWTMDAAELATTDQPTATGAAATATAAAPAEKAASAAPPPATSAASPVSASPPLAPAAAVAAPPPHLPCATAEGVQQIVNTALDAKLGPIRRELAEMRVTGPGITEIIGGLGWLVGLAGMGLYFRGRRG